MSVKSIYEELIEFEIIKDKILTQSKNEGRDVIEFEADAANMMIRNAIIAARVMLVKMNSVSRQSFELGKEAAKTTQNQAND